MTPVRASCRLIVPVLLAALAGPAWAQQHAPAAPGVPDRQAQWPAWEQLSPAQRELLVAPLRERWNADPGQRARMMEHARRWHEMTPQQREQARQGMRRYQGMSPQQREQARALFEHMRTLPPSQRKQLREAWKGMTPQQRQAWVRAHPPGKDQDPE